METITIVIFFFEQFNIRHFTTVDIENLNIANELSNDEPPFKNESLTELVNQIVNKPVPEVHSMSD